MNKLIKISNNHYIVVDDGEIKEGDYKYHHALGIRKALVDGNYTNTFKITHSTQPLESSLLLNFYVIKRKKILKTNKLYIYHEHTT